MEAQVVRHKTQGLGVSGVVLLAGMTAMLAGCSSLGQADQTAAIASPAVAGTANTSVGSVAGDTVAQPAGVGKAITLADATCDQIKAEIATFDADKIPAKLADFGKAKYHPTAEESIRFARYVDVEKASKDKNCAPSAMKKKQITASKTPASTDPAAKKAIAVKPVAKVAPQAQATAPIVAKAGAKNSVTPAADAATVPVEDGVTVTVPDSSG
jgi:hypothetical protein